MSTRINLFPIGNGDCMDSGCCESRSITEVADDDIPMKRLCCLELGKNSTKIFPQWWQTIANTATLTTEPSIQLNFTNS